MRMVQLVSFLFCSLLLMMPAHAGSGRCVPVFQGTIEIGTICGIDVPGGGSLGAGDDGSGLIPPSFDDQCPNGRPAACAECVGHACNKHMCTGADDCKSPNGVCQELGKPTCGSKT